MHYLTRAEYAKLYGVTRQNVAKRIKNKTIPTVLRTVRVERIPVDETEFQRQAVKVKELTPSTVAL